MNAIIWWLESPWQLRALVFALSFFVCFVVPWMHSQSLLISRLAAKSPLEEKSEVVPAPKADAPAQHAMEQAKAPVSQDQAPVQEKAPPQPAPASVEEKAPAAQEQGHPQAEGPVHATQVPVEVPVHEQAAAPVEATAAPAKQGQAPASVQGAPASAEAPVQQEQVPPAAQALVEATPAPAVQEQAPAVAPAPVLPAPVEAKAPVHQEQVPIPAQAPVEKTPALSEQKAAAGQEQSAVHEPVPPATAKAVLAGGFDIVNQSTSVIPVAAGSSVEKQELAAATEKGGSADVEIYVLSGKGLRRPNRVVDPSNDELSAVLGSDDFAKAAARYDTVACVGLGWRNTGLSTQDIKRLIDHRAVQLCGIIARKPYVSANTKLYGLPLGQQMDSAPSEKERAQKSLIIVGIKNAKGDLADAAVQKKMVSEIIRGGKIANFPLGKYSEVASGNELRYIEVKNGSATKNRPIKSSTVKPGYGPLQEAHRHSLAAHHKRCGASSASRALPISGKKVSRSQASGEARHHGCGIFDFPF